MNGYYQALQLDVDEIKRLQLDKTVLKQKVRVAGGKYANLIDIMNPPRHSDDRGNREYKEHQVTRKGNPKF
ncbi:hypothetical protein [Candidatus Scalindua japonica]|nr:hypothetical protein [Candidatus Scalindua japonica]